MESSVKNISEILKTTESFYTTGFSSGYNFDEIKASEFFDDLIVNSNSSSIFSGILIFEAQEKSLKIIDGLQRITTITLLLHALCEYYMGTTEQNEKSGNALLNTYLLDTEKKPKLKLTGEDRKIFEKIISFTSITTEESISNLSITHQTFLQKIKDSKLSGNDLFKIFASIKFMIIITEKTEISEREIYQTINQKSESQINLITDFVAQEGVEASGIFKSITDSFNGNQSIIKSFIKDFLTTRLDENEKININSLYNNFKVYFHKLSKYQDTKTILENMEKYSKYYLRIKNANFANEEVKRQISLLNENGGEDTYPYLMEVLDDLENHHITESAFLNILMMINLFIQNRKDISISNVNIDFSQLSKELNKMLVLEDYVPEILSENKLTINEINNLAKFEV